MIPVVMPSRGRARATGFKPEGTVLFVDRAEAESYRAALPGFEVRTHDGLQNLGAIRNAMLDEFGDCFMIDDDIHYLSRLYRGRTEKMDEAFAAEIVQNAYLNAKDAGAHVFGFSRDPKPYHFDHLRPIKLSGYVNAGAIGVMADGLRFTDRMQAGNGLWINLLNSYRFRKTWIDLRFCFYPKQRGTFFAPGGQAGRRTLASEREDTLFLRRKFGPAVKLRAGNGKTDSVVPLYQYQRTIRIPF